MTTAACSPTRCPVMTARSLIIAMSLFIGAACAVPDRVENLGIFGPSRTRSVLGQDGCTPIPAGSRVFWSFGDTILGTWKAPVTVNATFDDSADMTGMLSNAMAVTAVPDDESITALDFRFVSRAGTPLPVVQHGPGEDPGRVRLWALDGIVLNEKLYLYYLFIAITARSPNQAAFPFTLKGTGLAAWNMKKAWQEGEPVSFTRGPLLFREGEPAFGDAVIRRGDDCYIIGHGPAGPGKSAAFIARAAAIDIDKRSAYQFLHRSSGWTSNIAEAAPLFGDVMGEPSLSYNEYAKCYVVIYCSLSGQISLVAVPELTDLVRASPRRIYTPPPLPARAGKAQHYYSGKEIWHTQKATYAIYIHPAIYQPILLRIPHGIIDSEYMGISVRIPRQWQRIFNGL